MSRLLGLPLLLVSLAVGGYLFTAKWRSEGPTSPAVTRAEAQAEAAVAGTNFQGAAVSLQAWFAENGTYAGATLPPGLDRAEALNRIRGKHIGTFDLITEEEYAAGLERAERELPEHLDYAVEWLIAVAVRPTL